MRKRQLSGGDQWYLDELYFVTVRGERQILWRAVDQGSGQMIAAAMLVTIPVFIIVLLIRKQLAAGLTIGGVKG